MAEDSSVKRVIDLPIDDILPNRYQPRIKFDDDSIYELSESIKNHGVFQPILVRPIGDKYEIIAGERRYKASVLANKTTIPAIIMSLNDKDTVEVALIENVQRSNLTPIEEAISYKKILDMGYIKQEALAQKLGKTQSTIANKIRLLNLEEDVQEALLENKISERHARSLLKLKDGNDQRSMLKRIINERLTVRKTDEEIDKMLNNESNINVAPAVETPSATTPAFDMPVVEEVSPMPSSEASSTPSIFGFSAPVEPMKAVTGANESTVISSDQAEVVNSVAVQPTDLNKIQSQAAPVFEEKPLADMDALLKSTAPTEPIAPAAPVEPQTATPAQPTNRFFNFEPVAPVVEEKPQNPAGSGFNFDNFVATPIVPQETQAAPNFDDMFAKQTKLADEEVIIPAPTQYTNFNETAASPISEPAIAVPNNEVIAPNSFVNPAPVSVVPETPVATPVEPIAPVEPVVPNNFTAPEPVAPTSFATLIPGEVDLNTNVDNDVIVPKVEQKNVMAAVNVIRDAVTKLESLGYSVDADEIDLDSLYQIIIKIDK